MHVTTSVGLTGAVAGFLVLAIAGLATDAPLAQEVYPAMRLLTWVLILPLAALSLAVGIIQSLATPWGLFRYYWIIIKLVLTVLAVVVLAMQLQTIDLLAEASRSSEVLGFQAGRFAMVLHSAGGLFVLCVAIALSIYKPRGVTPLGAKAIAVDR